MDKRKLVQHLETIDRLLTKEATLCIYGSAPFILLDEEARASLDIDVARPYSKADWDDFRRAADEAGLKVDPEETYPGDHVELVSIARLCLPPPQAADELILWRGRKLTVVTVSPAQLVASKLIRYDEMDQADICYLCSAMKISFSDIQEAVAKLPRQFKQDPILLDNLESLRTDMDLWNNAD